MKIIITEKQQRKLSHIFTIGGLVEQKRVEREIEEISLKGIVQEISEDLNDLIPKIAADEGSTWVMKVSGTKPTDMKLNFMGKNYPFIVYDENYNQYIVPVEKIPEGRDYTGDIVYGSDFQRSLQIPDLFNQFIAAYPEYAYLFQGKYENDPQTNFIKKQINNVVVNVGFRHTSGAHTKPPGIYLQLWGNSKKFRKLYKDNKTVPFNGEFPFFNLVESDPGNPLLMALNPDAKKKNQMFATLWHTNTQIKLSDVSISAPPAKKKEIIDTTPVPPVAKEIKFLFQVTDPFQFDKPDLTQAADDAIKKEMQKVYNLDELGFLEDYLKTKINGKDIIVQAYSSIDAKSDELGGGGITECKPGKVMRKDYNLCLSQKRAETIVNHLNEAFPEIFGEANLIAKGMGELESPNSVNEPYYIKATAEHIKKYPELKLRLGQRFRNPTQKKHSDANRVATAADRKFVINLPGYTGVITEGAIRDIILTESQIKRLTIR